MHYDHPQHSSDEHQETATTSAGKKAAANRKTRRALLKATSLAPVIYTLPSGSALANSSTCATEPRAGDNFRPLTPAEEEQLNPPPDPETWITPDPSLHVGDDLGDGFVYQPNEYFPSEPAVKASCWSSLSPS